MQIADPLRTLGTRYEDLRKSHVDYAGKLEKEKEAAYGISAWDPASRRGI